MANHSQALSALAVGFPPVVPRHSRILILGSLPGAASIVQQQYYAFARNSFWPIMATLLGFDPALDYSRRLDELCSRGVALWDVCQSASRQGSLDAAIRAQGLVANDIGALLAAQPGIAAVFCNGATAAALYRRLVVPTLVGAMKKLPTHTLPSTSPAHASRPFADKLRAWSIILASLDR